MKNYRNKAVQKNNTPSHTQIPSVQEYMNRDLVTFRGQTDINEVIKTLLDRKISGAPVLDERGHVIGLIDDKDCLKVLFGDVYNRIATNDTVSHYMTNVMKSITSDQNILDAASMFISSPYKRLLVVDKNNKLVGQISRRDVLRAIRDLT